MKCAHPLVVKGELVGCGQCLCCRVNKRRLWTARLALEWRCHQTSWWVTLTYDEEHHPEDGSVSVRHAQDYLRELRRLAWPSKLRYFIVGEYGEESGRPHYHACIFGNVEWRHCEEAWKDMGHARVREVTIERLQYLAGYTVKKWTRETEVNRHVLAGRTPEFARMSLKPGIGALAVEDVANSVTSHGGAIGVTQSGDVPSSFRTGGRMWPLGRYLRGKLREQVLGVSKESELARAIRGLTVWHGLRHELDDDSKSARSRLNREEALKARRRIHRKERI